MNAETLTALKESIAHWKRLASGKNDGIGSVSCALCKMFLRRNDVGVWAITCDGCPVKDFTGQILCCETPYREAEDLFNPDEEQQSDEFRSAAQKEVEFLESLLPK